MYKKNWNALDNHSVRANGTIPVLAAPCNKRIHGAIVTNVAPGEFLPAGTPFYFDLATRTALMYKGQQLQFNGNDVAPNSISIADCIGGTETTMIDVPYGVLYIYKNTLPATATDAILNGIKAAGEVMLVFEMFNTANQ